MEGSDERKVADCVIIGAGMAGIAAARKLESHGHSVRLIEKSRGIGGRMATRRIDGESFDHGAQFMTARSEEFNTVVAAWEKNDQLSRWFGSKAHPRFRGLPTMNALAKQFAAGLDISREERITRLSYADDCWAVASDRLTVYGKKLLVTAPAPQAAELVHQNKLSIEASIVNALNRIEYEKCVALILLLSEPSGMQYPGFKRMENSDAIDVIADSQLKGTSRLPGLVIHSSPQFAAAHFDHKPEAIADKLLQEMLTDINCRYQKSFVQKWRYARRSSPSSDKSFEHSQRLPIWFAGDSFVAASVEGAYLSGSRAAESIIASFDDRHDPKR